MCESDMPSPALRDLRSEAQPYKRDRDCEAKWVNGTRSWSTKSSHAQNVSDELRFPDETQSDQRVHEDVCSTQSSSPLGSLYRTRRLPRRLRNHINTDKTATSRVQRKLEAFVESKNAGSTHLSTSFPELPPYKARTPGSVMEGTIRPLDKSNMYPVDRTFSTSDLAKPAIGLEVFVREAEKKLAFRQTHEMVTEEYEVLDASGNVVVLSENKRGVAKIRNRINTSQLDIDEDFVMV